jgi:hypothetical protein
MRTAGVPSDADPRVAKLLSLAADKFIFDTVSEAMINSDLRAESRKRPKPNDGAVVLEMEDLEVSYEKQGIFQRRRLGEKEPSKK